MQSPNSYFMDLKWPGGYEITTVFSQVQRVFFVLAALLSSASLQEEKQGLQKDALSDRSCAKSTLYQDEWETIPIYTFWILKKKKMKRKPTKCEKIFATYVTDKGLISKM